MQCFLSTDSALKWLEVPSVYKISKDELYELDEDSFRFLKGFISRENLELRVRSEEFLRSHPGSSLKTLNSFIDYCMKEGILTKKKTSVNYPAIIKSPEPSLRYLELQITNRCNLRCRHCYIGDTLPSIPARRTAGGPSRQGRGNKKTSFILIALSAESRTDSENAGRG